MLPLLSKKNKRSFVEPIDDTKAPSVVHWNDYNYTDTAKLVFANENVRFVNKVFKEIMLKYYNVNVGLQNEHFILEWLHESYYKLLDHNYHKIHTSKNAMIGKSRVRGYEYNYYQDKQRGIFQPLSTYNEGRIRQKMKDIIDGNKKRVIVGNTNKKDLVQIINRMALQEMVRVAKYKIDGWLNYQKMYNLHVSSIVPITSINRKPETEGFNTERKDSIPNGPIRMRPIMNLPNFGL